jgi:Cu(I)/Ag(I) efflux system membrane fusion protein
MKTKLNLLSLVYLLAFFFACSDKKKETHDDHAVVEHAATDEMPTEAVAPTFVVDTQFQKQLAVSFKVYVELKDAFVASDVKVVKAKAEETRQALSGIDSKLLAGEAQNDWMNYLAEIDISLKEIQATEDIEQQRVAFSPLSDNFYKSIKAFGLGGALAYYEYCPMAFNNEGAYWLSDNSAIRNPYFGDKMLKCGSVEEVLK